MNKQLLFMLGLCQKAGKLLSGEFMCEQAIRKKNACIVIVAKDASANTKETYKNLCKYYKIPIYIWGEKEVLGQAIGKGIRASIAVQDANFSKKIEQLLEAEVNCKTE